jgi:hypothetical protein
MGDGSIQVRVAGEDDLPFVGQDGYLATEVLQRKIAAGEVFVAEQDGVGNWVSSARIPLVQSALHRSYTGSRRVATARRGSSLVAVRRTGPASWRLSGTL